MAIPFLNNINLSDNELQNAKLHITGTAPTAADGQIYFDSSDRLAKYYSADTWVSLKQYSFSNGTFVNLSTSGSAAKPIITAELSATGTPSATVYLRGDNTWSPISAIPGTYTWTVSDGSNSTPVASGETVTFSGTANEIEVAESSRTVTIGLPDDVTIGRDLTVTSTLTVQSTSQSSFAGQVTIPIIPVASTDAASKDYVDNAVVGGLVYQGGYNAATNTPDLDSSPSASIKKGWTYTVTADGLFFTEQARVGDVIIAEVDAPTTLADWTTVQNNIDLASASQIGIGNVNIDGAGNKDGLSLAYASGTATVGLDINSLPNLSVAITSAVLERLRIPLYNNDTSSANERIDVGTLLSVASSRISKAYTISDTDTITYPFTLTDQNDVIIQLVDTVTNETVYADVDRISPTQATITFATTPTNSVRVLVQKIGQ
jgi:hypothetical protein